MAQPSKLARAQSRQGGANAPSSGSAGPTQPSGDTDQPSPFDFLNYVLSPVTEHDARPLSVPGLPPAPQLMGDTGMFDFLDHIPSLYGMYPDMIGTVNNGTPTFHFSTGHFVWTASVMFDIIRTSGSLVMTTITIAFQLGLLESSLHLLYTSDPDFLPSPVVGPVEVASSIVTAGSAPSLQGVSMPSTASSAHALVPCATPGPTATTHGVKLKTDTSCPTASVAAGLMSGSAAISGALQAKHPAPYNFLQHIPASQRMAHNRTTSLVHANIEVDEDPQSAPVDDVGPESEEEDREMEDGTSREELPMPLSTLVPWLWVRIPINLPQMPADMVLTKDGGLLELMALLPHMCGADKAIYHWQSFH
ncbi:hypothetical protein EI94DRAFT_1707748 [Lactarius quietus]|nr:hypothetical protein EI94DRAFT_1707748 [Lactarius quietus]